MKATFNDDDFDIQWFSGTGKGGQHRNKHQNCCRVVHKATGVKANGTENRSREANKRAAISVCKARVVALYSEDTERYRASSERVRTYHAVDNKVYDHASGLVKPYREVVDKNDISELVAARRAAMAGKMH
jgi:protein subunit release factor A